MHPGHEVINILGSRAFDGLLDVGSISPMVLIPTGNITIILFFENIQFPSTVKFRQQISTLDWRLPANVIYQSNTSVLFHLRSHSFPSDLTKQNLPNGDVSHQTHHSYIDSTGFQPSRVESKCCQQSFPYEILACKTSSENRLSLAAGAQTTD